MDEPGRDESRLRFGVPACATARDRVDRVLLDWDRERPDLDFTPAGVVSRLARERGDLITGLGGTAVTSSIGLAGLPGDLAGRRTATLNLLRGNDAVTVRLRLPRTR